MGEPSRTPATSAELVAHVADGGPAIVALSGGVDSSVVAWIANRALGREAHAVTLRGPAVSEAEASWAQRAARWIGIDHHVVSTDPLRGPEYRANPTNRCYFCRAEETRRIREWGSERGIVRYLDGVHADDLGDERPGLKAMDEAGFLHPLLWARWRKADVRSFARSVGLPNADRPSEACLASRVRSGEPISAALLGRIARAEESLLARGFRRVRVRAEGGAARIEVGAEEVRRLLEEPLASKVRFEVGACGFEPVTIDPAGYRWRPGE